ncbi:ParB N-terminal domain-containing protein, partial [Nocardia sp. NPDC050630]|uniref:ParB N-terminal domain-containing protein n=1 Tax=Nocardia sp. NPDC050630 TaxID=3364321 RepID=UPI0037967A71
MGVEKSQRKGLSEKVVAVGVERIRISGTIRVGGVSSRHLGVLAQLPGPLPPIVVHRATMEVIDGVHRLVVARRRKAVSIDVIFFDGAPQEAFVLAIELNSARGLPLSLADRKAAAGRMLADFPEWSNRRLAELAGLSDKTIASLRRGGGGGGAPPPPPGGGGGRAPPPRPRPPPPPPPAPRPPGAPPPPRTPPT